MTIEQFRLLNEMEKLSSILQTGRLLSQIQENECRIFLYRIDSFYVSACYSFPDDQLLEISCFFEAGEAVEYYRKHFVAADPSEREYHAPEI